MVGKTDFGLVQNAYNPYLNGGLRNSGNYNTGIGGHSGGIGEPQGAGLTEVQKFKQELGLGKTQAIGSVEKNQYVTNTELYNSVSNINGELSPELRNEVQGNRLYLVA